MKTAVFPSTALLTVLLSLSCGDDGNSNGGAAGSAGAAGTGGAAGASNEAGGAAGKAPTKGGFLTFGVVAESEAGMKTIYTSSVTAIFFDEESPASQPKSFCSTKKDGDCEVTTCDKSTGSANVPERPVAGDITFTGGRVSPIVAKSKDKGGFFFYEPDPALSIYEPILVGEETIKVSAPGLEVPTFSLEVKAPRPVKLGGFPVAPTGMSAALDTSQPLVLSLADGGEGTVLILVAAESSLQQGVLTCRKPASSSGVTVSASLLQKLKELDTKGRLSASLTTTGTVDASGWAITLDVYNVLRSPDGGVLDTFVDVTF